MFNPRNLTTVLLAATYFLLGCSCDNGGGVPPPEPSNILDHIQESATYTTKDSVAAYIYKFNRLPSNYVNKAVAQSMYEQSGQVFERWNFSPLQVLGVMVGGDYFGNSGGLLPIGDYRECDVDYHDSSRGTKRLVYAGAGVVYYTADHYGTFRLLYGVVE